MEVHIYSGKAKSQAVNIRVKNIKRSKAQNTQLGILKFYAFCRKIQQRASGQGESAAGVTYYQSLRIHPKT